jgi:hypothetical protein
MTTLITPLLVSQCSFASHQAKLLLTKIAGYGIYIPSPMIQSKLTNVLQLTIKDRTIFKLSTSKSGLSEIINRIYTSVKSVYTKLD